MTIYNEAKTEIISNPDLTLGYLAPSTLVHHYAAVEAVAEQSHYEVVATYQNGGKDVVKVIDVAGVAGAAAHDETENILVYILYTAAELLQKEKNARIKELKKLLADSDYKAIKFAEGELTEEEYAPFRIERRGWREEINSLEE